VKRLNFLGYLLPASYFKDKLLNMDQTDKLFQDFPPVSKEEWLEKVAKDLKGKSLEDLFWHLEEGITVEPFYHRSDLDAPGQPLTHASPGNDWEIGEYYQVEDIKQANEQALEGLANGVQALGFELYHPLQSGDLNKLLSGIELAYISTNFGEYYPEKHPLAIVRQLVALVKERGLDKQKIEGSVDFDPILDWNEPPLDDLAEGIQLVDMELPRFKIVQVNGRYYHAGPQEVSRELAYTIAKGNAYLSAMQERGVAPGLTNHHLQFSLSISTSYFVAMAKIRALKILWLNVLKGYGVSDLSVPEVVVHFAHESQDDNPNTNMIRAATQAMSAVIGGADRLYVLPANHALHEASTPFTRRVARNVQHLLKMESHLDKVVDPAAGSYYIEQLTQKLATKAWATFQKLEETKEFKV